jgi:ectoine hydroxylase-related dioxygenase (phytanoyl-CoA dioxygenase family)
MVGSDRLDKPVTAEDIAAYARDGVCVLRGVFTAQWLNALRSGVERNLAEPGPWAGEHGEGQGKFFDDYCNWERIPEYRSFVYESPAAAIAAAVMQSPTAQFFHEHVLVKEPGTVKRTPWHQDAPYYCVDGGQTVSFWIPLDAVAHEVCPEFVAGSHLWQKLFYPRSFANDTDYEYEGGGFETIPDIEGARDKYDIRSWALEPGDVILFHFRTVHGAPANPGEGRRRGFAPRWLGEDARFVARPGRTSPPYPGIGLETGERMREDWFPTIWPPLTSD